MNAKIVACALSLGVCLAEPASAGPFPFLFEGSQKDREIGEQADFYLSQLVVAEVGQPAPNLPYLEAPPRLDLASVLLGAGSNSPSPACASLDRIGDATEALMRARFDVYTIMAAMVGTCASGKNADVLLEEIDTDCALCGAERARLPDYVAGRVAARVALLNGDFSWHRLDAGRRYSGEGLESKAEAEGIYSLGDFGKDWICPARALGAPLAAVPGWALVSWLVPPAYLPGVPEEAGFVPPWPPLGQREPLRPITDGAERDALEACAAACASKSYSGPSVDEKEIGYRCSWFTINRIAPQHQCEPVSEPRDGDFPPRFPSSPVIPVLGGFYGDVLDPTLDPGAPASLQ